jgi:hypothetical protein
MRNRCFGLLVFLAACGDSAASSPDASTADATPAPDAGVADAAVVQTTFRVFDHIPQFGIYVSTDPAGYTPPTGVVMWSHGTEFLTKLSAEQKAQIGGDLAARVTYHAQCDNYDRLGGLFLVVEPKDQVPMPTDTRTELVRFITPFSDYTQGARATAVFPDADLSPYAKVLADGDHDVWIGIAGGSNPYDGDPCSGAAVTPQFAAVGFAYSVDFVSSKPLPAGDVLLVPGVVQPNATSVPVTGVLTNPGPPISGHVTVVVSGHGSAGGGDEYEYTQDALSVNGQPAGSFSTMIDCAPFRAASPDGNPGIFQNNLHGNPRNWCPGALVPAHSFPVTLATGENPVSLGISPGQVPSGSYYSVSIHFSAP